MSSWLNSLSKIYLFLAAASPLHLGIWFEKLFTPYGLQAGPIISDDVQDYIGDLVNRFNVSGLALTVVRPDGEVEFGIWGNRTEDGDEVAPETLFILASCSKAFASASMGIMIDDFANGRNATPLPEGVELGWHTKIKDLLPGDWQLQDPIASENANLLDILSHVSGLPRHDLSVGPQDTIPDVIRRMKYLRPAYELRQQFSYNNLMYMTAAHIISTYSGTTYPRFLKDRIFTPLEMHSSTISPTEARRSGLLTQAWAESSRRIPIFFDDKTAELDAGAGAIISSAADISKWLRALINAGVNPITNETVIPMSAFETATVSRVIVEGKGSHPNFSLTGYGMGWFRFSYHGHEIVWHSGSVEGVSTIVAFLPKARLGVAVLINMTNRAQVNDAVLLRIVEEALNLPHNEPPPVDLFSNLAIEPWSEAKRKTPLLPLSSYAGTYSNPGYGEFTLCDPSAESPYCKTVLGDFETVDSATNNYYASTGVPQLYAAWPRLGPSGTTHLRLTSVEGDSFNISLPLLFPKGYGANEVPFEVYSRSAQVEFDVQNDEVIGFGIFGLHPPDSTLYNPNDMSLSLAERAEVYFRKKTSEKHV